MQIPDIRDIEAAARRISGFAVRTPLLSSDVLDALVGGRVLVKAECLQRTGSFKFRGAFNRISQLNAEQNPGGVVAYSSGNHAQGVAAAARIAQLPCLIVMPSVTPDIKRINTLSHGAEIVLYDREKESREAIAAHYAAKRQAVLVPPYEDIDVIAGQGTIGLEMAADAAAAGLEMDQMLVCCSGGGLAAGIAISLSSVSSRTNVHTVEPQGFDDMARSLRAGKRVRNQAMTGSVCDALLSPEPGEIAFAAGQTLFKEGLVVVDGEALAAVKSLDIAVA